MLPSAKHPRQWRIGSIHSGPGTTTQEDSQGSLSRRDEPGFALGRAGSSHRPFCQGCTPVPGWAAQAQGNASEQGQVARCHAPWQAQSTRSQAGTGRLRDKVEHPFRVIKQQFPFSGPNLCRPACGTVSSSWWDVKRIAWIC